MRHKQKITKRNPGRVVSWSMQLITIQYLTTKLIYAFSLILYHDLM